MAQRGRVGSPKASHPMLSWKYNQRTCSRPIAPAQIVASSVGKAIEFPVYFTSKDAQKQDRRASPLQRCSPWSDKERPVSICPSSYEEVYPGARRRLSRNLYQSIELAETSSRYEMFVPMCSCWAETSVSHQYDLCILLTFTEWNYPLLSLFLYLLNWLVISPYSLWADQPCTLNSCSQVKFVWKRLGVTESGTRMIVVDDVSCRVSVVVEKSTPYTCILFVMLSSRFSHKWLWNWWSKVERLCGSQFAVAFFLLSTVTFRSSENSSFTNNDRYTTWAEVLSPSFCDVL